MVGISGRSPQWSGPRLQRKKPPEASAPRRRRPSLLTAGSLAGKAFALQIALIVLLVGAAVTALVLQARHDSTQAARARSLAVAETFAHAPGTLEALSSADPTAVLQPRTEAARKLSDVDYISVFSTAGIRYTHSDPALIGKHVIRPYEKALRGETITQTLQSPLGSTVSSIVPVKRPDGSVAALVSVGITVPKVNDVVKRQLPVLIGSAAAALALATASAALVNRRLRRQTRGLGPAEMSRMYAHHDAVLHAVKEGVLIVGGEGWLLLANDEARRLLDLPADAERRHVTDLGLDPWMSDLLTSGRTVTDEVHQVGARLLVVNHRSTARHGGPPGSVVTLRNSTELAALSGKAEVARGRLRLLYEAGVAIGTTLDVTRTAEELTEAVVPGFADYATVDLVESVLSGAEPLGGRAGMRRTALRGIDADAPLRAVGESFAYAGGAREADDVTDVRARLDPVLGTGGRWTEFGPDRASAVLAHGLHSRITVPLRARGVFLGMATFWRSDSPDPFDEGDLSIAEELGARSAVSIDNAGRYSREHTMAATLQRNLLPRVLPQQDALEVAHRYRPAQAGVGGDWFDVIPLSGARVALVVGDVVGHGLHAAATMGRLRTAVNNFSALDLPPDEVLGRLDDLVARIDQEEVGDVEEEAITGATCLYAVYSPVSRNCILASAGHPPPAIVHPEGTVTFPEIPSGPPLGLSTMSPETMDLRLSEGTDLVFYTDGLIEDRDRDISTGLDMLRDILARAHHGPEQICQAVFDTMVPDHPRDDVALLVARTRVMPADKVAEWDVALDPAAVAPVRAAVTRWLTGRGLEEQAFVTELILSELITNAIRYGSPPITVRLLLGRSLICEVSDTSSTSPHLRTAAATDEGGRGLFLVAQFAERWGTRYTAEGKVIWTEQTVSTAPRRRPAQP